MKNAVLIFISSLFFYDAFSQYYLRGEIKDENNTLLPNVKILLHSNGYLYHSGSDGAFGIIVSSQTDTLTLAADGFQSVTIPVKSEQFQSLVIKTGTSAATGMRRRLLSLTRHMKASDRKGWSVGGETYSTLLENAFIPATQFPETGFALTIDKASYSNVRRFLNMGSTIPPDAVRIEELLNYFNFGYQPPPPDSNFYVHSNLSPCPWNAGNQLLFLQVCARKVDPALIPPANLVFLIDVSGSMDMPNKLPLLKSAFNLLINNLRPIDTVSIVIYGSTVGVWLQPTSGSEKKVIKKAIEDLDPGGLTPGEAGIRAAYRLAKSQFRKGGNNRVILATDGDFNVGESSELELENLVTQHKEWGIYLTCLGVGMGNYKDSKLEILAKKGNGNFAYLDDEREAEKVLVREFTQTVYAVADDAYLNISFDPALVKDYRLIGFDNKMKMMGDSLSELQGGEVGSGHSLLALFELTTTGNLSVSGTTVGRDTPVVSFAMNGANTPVAHVTINYKLPNDSLARMTAYDCSGKEVPFGQLQPCYRFASSIALFGGLLKKSRFVGQAGWKDVKNMAENALDPSDGMQQEFIDLVEKARKIYAHEKRHHPKGDD